VLLPAPLCVSAIWNVYSASLVWCSLSVPTTLQSVPKYLVWFMFSLTEMHPSKLWCWVVIKVVCRMRFLFTHSRSVWCSILITLQVKPEELSDYILSGKHNITGTFLHFWRTKFIINFIKVTTKNSTMVAFCPGGLLSRGLLSVHRYSAVHHVHFVQHKGTKCINYYKL